MCYNTSYDKTLLGMCMSLDTIEDVYVISLSGTCVTRQSIHGVSQEELWAFVMYISEKTSH